MEDGATKRARLLLAAVLALCGLGSVDAGPASAATGYRLTFGSSVYNVPTAGPLIVHGHRHRATITTPMVADQIIRNADGSSRTRAGIGQLIYEEYPGSHDHRHWHFKRFVRYQLRSVSDLSLVRRDSKAGFCLSDADYAPDNCGYLQRKAREVNEGLGPDRTDYYSPNLEGQWIDVQGVRPGDYWLVHWVNSSKGICETDYSNNAAAVKIALWPNGYGRAPYFTVKQIVQPFPSLFSNLRPPTGCGAGSTPAPTLPDLVQQAPSGLAVTPFAVTPGTTPLPWVTERVARRSTVLALTQRFHRRPKNARVACRAQSRTSFRCSVRWSSPRYANRGKVRIFTAPLGSGFERRFDLRILRTDRVCVARHEERCSRTVKASNVPFRRD
jgi:Lysyl oxidase